MADTDKLVKVGQLDTVADAVIDVISNTNERLDSLGDGVPTEVRQAILTLFQSAAYAETGLTDEVAVIESWAAVVTAIALNKTTVSINGANTYQLVATTTPAGGTVTWVSSDTSVATVSSSGLVTGVGSGSCTITASCGGKKAICSVTVSGFASLTGITATYTQSGTVYNTDTLNSLKSDLVVTASYSDGTTRILSDSDYTLSGTLVVGTSTVTVTYSGKTDTFDVTVTEYVDTRTLLYNWDLTNSLTDTVEGKTATITGATQDSSGVHLTARENHVDFSGILAIGRTVEVDVASYSRQGTVHGRFIMVTGGDGFIYNRDGYWGLFLSSSWENTEITDPTFFNGKTVVIKFTSAESGTLISVYCDNELIVENVETATVGLMMLGSQHSNSAYNSTFTAVRVYEGV